MLAVVHGASTGGRRGGDASATDFVFGHTLGPADTDTRYRTTQDTYADTEHFTFSRLRREVENTLNRVLENTLKQATDDAR